METKALTLWPEWAWAVDLPEKLAKRVKNLGYALPVGVWIYLHAGKHIGGRPGKPAMEEGFYAVEWMARDAGLRAYSEWDPEDYDAPLLRVESFGTEGGECFDFGWGPMTRRPIVTSAILGKFRVLRVLPPGVVEDTDGVRGWKVPDAFGNVFEYRRLNQPVLCKGAQGLWRPSEAVEMEIANVGFEVQQ